MKRILLIVIAAWMAVSCGSDSKTTDQVCEPGVVESCTCSTGGSGTHECASDGTNWGMCIGCAILEDVPDVEDIVEQIDEPDETTPDMKEKDESEEPDEVEPDVLPLICLLNNCTKDAHCSGCSDGRNTCLVAENRCVACDPNSGAGCDAGEACTSWGICAPPTLTCPTDNATGEPEVVCVKNADCKACSPKYQVCNTTSHKCVNCTSTNTSHCQQSDVCIDDKCSPRCPASCEFDNDCMFCGPPDNPLHACNKHKCAECSESWPCPEGLVCLSNGSCYPPCGIPGPVQGNCSTDEDCHFCGDPKTPGTYVCRTPLNDPVHGTCQPPAEGCEDLGKGVAVLPEPWSDYTQLCSEDANCENVGALINIGKVIRDTAGVTEVAGVAIGDANIEYKMGECAEIKVLNNIECGICVPCDKDDDCDPIAVDPLIPQLFPEDALVQIAGAILVDLLWGDIEEHNLNFYCQPVAFGYGVCAPCANPLQVCGKSEPEPGECPADAHDVCEVGDALAPSCGACAAAVCAVDSYCCTVAWDEMCKTQVDTVCATPCGGGGGCANDICENTELPAQDPSCGECVAAICEADAFCCNKESGAWDGYCVEAATLEPACAGVCGGGCAHGACEVGGPLDPECDECVASVCTTDDFCCTVDWDSVCVGLANEDAACPVCE